MWDTMKCMNTHVNGVPTGGRGERGTERIFKEIITKNLPKCIEKQ